MLSVYPWLFGTFLCFLKIQNGELRLVLPDIYSNDPVSLQLGHFLPMNYFSK